MTVKHRLSKVHPLYSRWSGMRARCNNPNHVAYARYGGRGIKVCVRWEEFDAFLADMGPTWPGEGYEMHRLDNDGNYSAENCCWISKSDHTAMPKSAEHRAKIGAAHKGRVVPRDHILAMAAKRRIEIDVEHLRDAYEVKGCSLQEIAEQMGCGKSTVHRAVRRFDLVKAGTDGESPGLDLP